MPWFLIFFGHFLLQVHKKHGRKSKKQSVRSQPKAAAPTTQKRTYSHTRTRQQKISLIVAIILGIILLPLTLAVIAGFCAGWALQSCKDRAIQRELRKAYLETKRQREAEEAAASTSGMIVMEWSAKCHKQPGRHKWLASVATLITVTASAYLCLHDYFDKAQSWSMRSLPSTGACSKYLTPDKREVHPTFHEFGSAVLQL